MFLCTSEKNLNSEESFYNLPRTTSKDVVLRNIESVGTPRNSKLFPGLYIYLVPLYQLGTIIARLLGYGIKTDTNKTLISNTEPYSSILQIILAYASTTTKGNHIFQPLDSDSFEVKIDNCSNSPTLSGHKGDFIQNTLKPIRNVAIEGYSSTGELEYFIARGGN
jgi:hypothetical protein